MVPTSTSLSLMASAEGVFWDCAAQLSDIDGVEVRCAVAASP